MATKARKTRNAQNNAAASKRSMRRPAAKKVTRKAAADKVRLKFDSAAEAKQAEERLEKMGDSCERTGRTITLGDASNEKKIRAWAKKNGIEVHEARGRGRPPGSKSKAAKAPAKGRGGKSATDRIVLGETKPILRVKIVSSNIDSAAYNFIKERLTVKFNNGSSYAYREVTMDEFLDFVCAKSAGSYLNEHIKPNKPFAKLDK